MIKHLKLIGSKVISFGAGIAWQARFLWAIGFLIFTGFLILDLFRIPVSVNNSHEYAAEQTLWDKKDPHDPAVLAEEKALKELQERCPHVYEHNGLSHYYCPICRKKLTTAKPPLTPLQGTIVRT